MITKKNNFSLILYFLSILINSIRTEKLKEQQNYQQQVSTFHLPGSPASYAQYFPWYSCLNGTLIFEFKTHDPNGLLLYAQSLPYKYIQLSLVDGFLRMRMRIGEKDNPRGIFLLQPIESNRLNDEKWHEVRIIRQNERTILSIDNQNLFHVHKDSNLDGYDLYFGDLITEYAFIKNNNNNLYFANNYNGYANLLLFGGIPPNLQTYDLSLGTALFEPRYNGYIRNVRALNCSSEFLIRLNVASNNNLRYSEVDACISSPCLNNGVCLVVTDSNNGYICDCSYTNYEGKNCDRLKPPRSSNEITLTGKEYFSFEVPYESELSTTYEEEFNLDFKTTRSTGLLVYAGHAQDYFVFGLQDGGLYFKLNIKGQTFEKTITISGTFLHNNHWHCVKFIRRIRQIEITIDNIKKDHSDFNGDFIAMQTKTIYIGGVPKQTTIYRTISKNFIGCLRNITLKTGKVSLNLIDLALNDSKQISKHGIIEKTCRKTIDPITFSSPISYIPVSDWKGYPDLRSFSIEFQTTENHGVLVYILGSPQINKRSSKISSHNSQHQSSSLLKSLNRDFFSLEIHNRFLNAYFNLGASYIRHEVVHEHVSSGKPHQISVEINENYAIFKFDQKPETSVRIDNSTNKLDLEGPLIIGGIYPNHTAAPLSNPSLNIPPYFYSGMLGHGYVGCIQGVEINGQSINLTHFASLAKVGGISTDMCTPMPNQCDIGHCLNEGLCMEGWNRFFCDCSATGFNGPICNQPAMIANFAEGQYIRIKFNEEWISETEHISLRFKTEKKSNCILLNTHSLYSKDLLEISLENSHVKLYIRIGNSEATMSSNEGFTDGKWHTIRVIRESARLTLEVDNDEPATDSIDALKNKALAYGVVELGSKLPNRVHQRDVSSFEGQMQQLIINGRSYFELIANGEISNFINRTVTFLRDDIPHKYPLTFHNTQSWLVLPKIDAFHTLLIQFHFRTIQYYGLILYNRGQNDEFIAVELDDGQISFLFSIGRVIHKIKTRSKEKLNDEKWHLVSIWRSTKTNYELSVDSLQYKYMSNQNEQKTFHLIDKLYVGGLKNQSDFEILRSKYKIVSHHGYKGCLASLEINGRVSDFDEILTNSNNKMSENITKGCEKSYKCQKTTCKNGGTCIEKWNDNSICNCDMTTFTGNYCEYKSKGYIINKGYILFEYKSPLYWQEDNLAFGIETNSSDSLLFKATSGRTNKTILIELNEGYVQSFFNDFHGTTHYHSFKNYRINDNKYHIIRLNIVDFNSSFNVDGIDSKHEIIPNNYDLIKKKSKTDSTSIFVQIAGTKESTSSNQLEQEFNGNLFGLIYNKYKILNLVNQNDSRTKTTGDLKLIDKEILVENDLNQQKEIESKIAKNKKTEDAKYENRKSEYDDKTDNEKLEGKTKKKSKEIMSDITTTIEFIPSTTKLDILTTSEIKKTLNDTENNYIIISAIVISAFLLLLIIIAIYKYRNRDEGTYRIDESKNCGPFAELQTPLTTNANSSNIKPSNGNKKYKKRFNNPNKEWYV